MTEYDDKSPADKGRYHAASAQTLLVLCEVGATWPQAGAYTQGATAHALLAQYWQTEARRP